MTKVTILNITWKRVVRELHLWNAYLEVIKYRDIKRDIKAHPRKKYHDDVKVVTPIVTWKRTFIPLEVRTSVEGGARDLVEKGGRGRCDRSRATEGATGNGTGSRVIQRGFTPVLVYAHRFTRRKCKEKNEGECRKRRERSSLPFLNSASFRAKWKVV